MADCFWTDFVGCAEDCGGAPPAAGPAVLMGLGAAMGAGGSGSGDAIPYLPLTGVRIDGVLQFDAVAVYGVDGDTGCSWVGFVATTDEALAGTTVEVYDSLGLYGGGPYTVTWKLVSDFPKTASPLASGANIPLTPIPTSDGGPPPFGSKINSDDLLTALGYNLGDYDYSGLLIVATLRNVDTDEAWEATWALDTCY